METMTRLINLADPNSTKEIFKSIRVALDHINQEDRNRNIDIAFRLHELDIPSYMKNIQKEILSRKVHSEDLESATHIVNLLLLLTLETIMESYMGSYK